MAAELQKLEGVVDRVIFQNPQNGYTVAEVSGGGESLILAGALGEVYAGQPVTAYGTLETHPRYGLQFKAVSCEAALPADAESMLAFLSSGAVKGVGPGTAKKLVKKFGGEVLDVITSQPERLLEVKGITQTRAAAIAAESRRILGAQEAVRWLGRFGVSASQAVAVYRELGAAAVPALEQNPYLLCGEAFRFRFAQADGIAAALGMDRESRLRLTAGLVYVLRHNAAQGHTCLPRTALVLKTASFLQVEPSLLEKAVDVLAEEHTVELYPVGDAVFVFLQELFAAEENVARRLAFLAGAPLPQEPGFTLEIEALEAQQGFAYAPGQREAIRMALTNNVMVLTGGPGTGKTTTVNAILSILESRQEAVRLAAPTGRAAKRLAEVTHRQASTIHRLLEVDYSGGSVRFVHNRENRLKADIVILDEMSMVDVRLFDSLLEALRSRCRLILVGDAEQLPSVGPGNVLGEILASGIVPTVCLDEVFRQASQSLIVTNAHRVSQGQPPAPGRGQEDYFFLPSEGLACQSLVLDLVCRRLPRSYGLDPVRDIQVLCPTKLGPCGSQELGRALQAAVNPPGAAKPELSHGGRIYRMGDKVMQVQNDYDLSYEKAGGEEGIGAFNGDIGIVTEVKPAERTVRVQMDDRSYVYPQEKLGELELAYAVTIHKSQGSEFPCVVMPLSGTPQKLCYRNLFYTGLTRARRLCIVAGQGEIVERMVRNVRQNLRYSCLAALLRAAEGTKAV